MPQMTAADLKPVLSLEDTATYDDAMIEQFIASAEARIKTYCRQDFDAVYPSGWPADLVQVIRIMVADWYANRESMITGVSATPMLITVQDMLAEHRDLAA